ncbi:MAG: hypothetical protein EOM23_00215 [Candidatus Moranbacteria bacterium]|nr:hypothetical protein [Candidatus Moranbacteria bacterium]
MSRLFIAEKHSVGRAIANEFGIKTINKNHIICENDNIVTWCAGHLLSQAEPDAYDNKFKKWNSEDLPIIPQKWKYIEGKKEYQKQQLMVIDGPESLRGFFLACGRGQEAWGCVFQICRSWSRNPLFRA